MFKNYLKTAFRNLTRQKSSTFINIAGLTLGISSSLVLFLILSYHTSFDTAFKNYDRIYRIVNSSNGNQGVDYQAGVPAVLPDAFRLDFPEAEDVAFTSYRSGSLVTIPQSGGDSKKYQEERGVVYTEPSFFKIFDRAVISGDVLKGIDEPNEAVISTGLAKKYFGKEDVLGEVLRFENKDFKISAVVADAPFNTDFPFDLFLSYSTIKKEREEPGWASIWSDEQCYFTLKQGETPEKINARMEAFSVKHQGKDDPDKTRFMLQPLRDLHFDDRFDVYSYTKAPKAMLFALGIIALVLIVTACINFINLATAEAIKRSKEVGIRKSLGSTRGQLVFQFLGETTLITSISVILSLGLTQLALTLINPMLELKLALDFANNTSLCIYIISLTVLVSVLSGLYPAFIVSGFKPALVLKNQMNAKNSSSFILRQVLVVFQFSISQWLIIVTIVMIFQMNFYQQKDLGFNKDAIIIVPIPEREGPENEAAGSGSKMRTLRDAMLRVPGVEMASLNSTPPSSGHVSQTNFSIQGHQDQTFETQVKQIDGNYLDLFGMKLIAGSNIQDLDTAIGYVVNEKFARTAGFQKPEEILGTVIRVWRKEYPVVGVVQDFHTQALHSPIEATVLFNRIRGYESLALKISLNQVQDVIRELESKWEAAYPNDLFGYEFLDESIRHFYDGEKRWAVMLSVFTGMAIFIGCLGLFGLATFMANQKTKEIGVRKVLGASVESIVLMFSKQFFVLIVIGFVVAAPLAWFAMSFFLQQFAYQIPLGPGIFLLGFGITLIIAMVTVSYKSIKAAVVNPVQSLRYE
jgi:putative ABC transport system permease protein